MFRGHFKHTIDPKGRLSIPAKFREALEGAEEGDLVIVPTLRALDVHPVSAWRDLESRVAALPKLDGDRRRFLYSYLSLGLDVALDGNGRIQVSQDYRERAGLRKDVVVIGMMEHFEVWDAERWTQHEREGVGTFDELLERLAAKGV